MSYLDEVIKAEKERKSVEKKVKTTNADKNVESFDKKLEFLDSLNADQQKIFLKEAQYQKAHDKYIEYVKLCYPTYIFTPFHRYLCNLVQNVVSRIETANKPDATREEKLKGRLRVIVSVPPQHGKSETITKTAPSWFVGRNPDIGAMLTAYNSDLAEKFNDANRQKIIEHGKKVFGIEVSDTTNNKSVFEIKGHRGFIMGAGIQAGLTGNGGGLIIVDDPYKNSIEANSPTTRETIYNVYKDSVATRLRGNGQVLILIQTRWHENDLAGVLSKADNTIVINIPCVCEDEKTDPLGRKLGETLCPELGFDADWAEAKRKEVGEKVWSALYQGHPSIDGGEIFTRDMIHHYTKSSLPTEFDKLTMSCDLSFGGIKKSNDPCAIQVWGKKGANHYLLYRFKKRLTFIEMCEKIRNVSNHFPQATRKIVEKKANGQAVIDTLNGEIGGFIAYDPKMESKVGRANAVVPLWESGNIYLPDKTIDNTIDEFEEELMKFPNGEHDDEVDAMTQYLVNENSVGNGCGKICVDSFYGTLANTLKGLKL